MRGFSSIGYQFCDKYGLKTIPYSLLIIWAYYESYSSKSLRALHFYRHWATMNLWMRPTVIPVERKGLPEKLPVICWVPTEQMSTYVQFLHQMSNLNMKMVVVLWVFKILIIHWNMSGFNIVLGLVNYMLLTDATYFTNERSSRHSMTSSPKYQHSNIFCLNFSGQ